MSSSIKDASRPLTSPQSNALLAQRATLALETT